MISSTRIGGWTRSCKWDWLRFFRWVRDSMERVFLLLVYKVSTSTLSYNLFSSSFFHLVRHPMLWSRTTFINISPNCYISIFRMMYQFFFFEIMIILNFLWKNTEYAFLIYLLNLFVCFLILIVICEAWVMCFLQLNLINSKLNT